MSKANRNKKTPMFVSTINSNYDFVDYTDPAQAAQQSFGNPNASPLNPAPQSQPQSQLQPPSLQSPKKAQTNWFDQMLNTQPQSQPQQNPTSPTRPPALSFDSAMNAKSEPVGLGSNFSNSYQSTGFVYNSSAPVGSPTMKKQPDYTFGKKDTTQFEKPKVGVSSPVAQTGQPQGYFMGGSPKFENKFQYGAPSYDEPKRSEFVKKTEYNYQTNEITTTTTKYGNSYSNGSSNGFSLNQPLVAEKPKYQSFQPSSPVSTVTTTTTVTGASSKTGASSSSGGFGFTDESLVNSLPEPARSNILAMIRRNKGLSN